MNIKGIARARIISTEDDPKKLSGKMRVRNSGTTKEIPVKTAMPAAKPYNKELLKSFLVFWGSLECSENTGYRIVPKATGMIVAASRNLKARL